MALAGCATHSLQHAHRARFPLCASPAPPPSNPPAHGPPPDPRAIMVDLATSMLGQPYRFGGAAPGGFDCSGLVVVCGERRGRSRAAHRARTAACGNAGRAQRSAGGRSGLHASRAQGTARRHRHRRRTLHSCALRRRPCAHRLARRAAVFERFLERAAHHRRAMSPRSDLSHHPLATI